MQDINKVIDLNKDVEPEAEPVDLSSENFMICIPSRNTSTSYPFGN